MFKSFQNDACRVTLLAIKKLIAYCSITARRLRVAVQKLLVVQKLLAVQKPFAVQKMLALQIPLAVQKLVYSSKTACSSKITNSSNTACSSKTCLQLKTDCSSETCLFRNLQFKNYSSKSACKQLLDLKKMMNLSQTS